MTLTPTLLLAALALTQLPAHAQPYTVDQIAQALTAHHPTDLSIDYSAIQNALSAEATTKQGEFRLEGHVWYKHPAGQHKIVYRTYYATTTDKIPLALDPHQTEAQRFAPRPNETLHDHELFCFDGQSTLRYPILTPKNDTPNVSITAGNDRRQLDPLATISPIESIWGSNKGYAYNLTAPDSHFTIESQDELIDGLHTVKLVGTCMKGFYHLTLWVAPDRGFLPIKVSESIGKSDPPFLILLKDLVQLNDHTWFPMLIVYEGIDHPELNPGRVLQIRSVKTDPLPADTFRPSFPAGTLIKDFVNQSTFTLDAPPGTETPIPYPAIQNLQEWLNAATRPAK